MGGSAKTKQNTTSTYKPTPEASGMYSNIFNQATAAQSGYNPATAQQVAGFNPTQQAGFGQIGANQGSWQPGVTQGGQMISGAGAPITAADISAFMNPYQSDVIGAQMQQMAQADAAQGRAYTANQVAQGGLGGSGYHIGRARLAGDQAQARNNTLAGLNKSGWDSALAAAQADKTRGLTAGQSMANIGQLTSQLGYQDANAQLTAGNQQQAQEQAGMDASSKNALNEQLWPMQQAQWLASIGSGIGPLMGGTTKSAGTAEQSQGKGIGNAIGGALTLAGMASDERVKENAVEIGRSHDGQPIWEFNYKGDPRRQIGLMAQEVERHTPEAVTDVGGVKHVNYGRALEGAERYASGGSVEMPDGLMPWAELKPAQLHIPQAPEVSAPAAQQQGGQDWEAMYKSGQKAGSGLSSLFGGPASPLPSASSPAGGALAASGMQGAGDMGGLGGLGSMLSGLFGFADGGLVASPEEMHALEMVESNGRDIVNPKSGAFGPRQLMPATARDPGFGVRPLDPSGGIGEQRRFSDDYFNAMLKRYDGDRDAARIAYNGGPRRADNWLRAGRNDAVIPQESADYYKKVARQLGQGGDVIVAKGVSPEVSASAGGGEPYRTKADAKSGGMLQRMFGVEFNPLGLTEPERKAMVIAGLSMLSHGDVGRGGIAGMQYLSGVEAGEREAGAERNKLAYQMRKDEQDLALRTRSVVNDERKTEADMGRAERTYDLDAKRFDHTRTIDADKLKLDREKLEADASKPTNDMREYDFYKREETEAGRTPKPFGEYQQSMKKAGSGASLSGELSARIGMGRVFIGDMPVIEARINGMTPAERANLALGRGNAAELWRQIETGREALMRMNTGAGMPVAEAQNANARYQISPTDKKETMLSKVRKLKIDLEGAINTAIEGKSGQMVREYVDPDKPRPVQTETILPGFSVIRRNQAQPQVGAQ